MMSKIFKSALFFAVALLSLHTAVFAQAVIVATSGNNTVTVKASVNEKDLQVKMNEFGKSLTTDLKDMAKSFSLNLDAVTPKLSSELSDLVKSFSVDVNIKTSDKVKDADYPSGNIKTDNDQQNNDAAKSEKFKSYIKSYPIDGNDRIKIANRFGKITVTTWDKHEVKVDVQIKAESNSDGDAQSLLDGVQINDNKSADQVTFRTDIEHNNSSWKIWNWGGNNKVRKITINYTVYMPAKTDLNVEQSYGAIVLPNLEGRVKISSSYGSVTLQNLTNTANDIEGSYGNLKMGSMNGGRLEFSYGDVDIAECNNLKGDLSYGSFKLGRLKGAADLNLSNVGGVKIGELASSFRRLNINSSYSSVALNVGESNNFDFNITTTYGGFNYNDGKVTITSKTPADGSSYFSNTKNYKGHLGKGGDAQVVVRASYGGVSFE